MADPNTRQGKRTPVTLKIKFKSETLEQFIERYAVDVSQGGIFIRTKEPLAVGTQMRFEFQLRDASPLIGGEGTVVWTRENDPSRPAIAPGMGVRFDRLAEGSQAVLERILAEKAKQAPVRPEAGATKPPLFTDTPTRVAPPPVQDALLGNEKPGARKHHDSFNDQSTPLPKPMPFHSDADEFPDEAFEEATKVRALDDLVAQTALDGATNPLATPLDELAARRNARGDATVTDPSEAEPEPTLPPGNTAVGVPKAPFDRDSAPNLPSPPIPGDSQPAKAPSQPPLPAPRLLDTSPSPRTEGVDPMEQFQKTKLGMEPVSAQTRSLTSTTPSSAPPPPIAAKDAPTKPTGMRAVAAEPTAPVRVPTQGKSKAPLLILLLVVLAGGGAALWFLVLRDKLAEDSTEGGGAPVAKKIEGSGSAGSNAIVDNGSAKKAGSNEEKGSAGSGSAPAPKADLVELEIAAPAGVEKARVEVVDSDQRGDAPFKAKLEKGKTYKVRVLAPHYLTAEIEVKGGQTDKPAVKLEPKPHVLDLSSDPKGALISVNDNFIGHSTPYRHTLDAATAAKKTLRVRLVRSGFKPVEKVVAIDAYVEDDTAEVYKMDEKLAAAPVVINTPPRPPTGSGGSGSATPTNGSDGSGGATPPPQGSDTPKPPEGSSGGGSSSSGGGSSKEPEPGFVKDPPATP